MKRNARQFPFGEELALIPLGVECLQVCAAPRAPGRYNVLLCPGPIVELCAPPQHVLVTVVELVMDEAQRLGAAIESWVQGDSTIRLRLEGNDLTLDSETVVEALRLIADATRTLFMPAFDRQIDLVREMSAHSRT